MTSINKFIKDLSQIYNNSPTTIQYVLNYNLINTQLNSVDHNKNTILHNIVMKNDDKTLAALLNYYNVNNFDLQYIVNMQNTDGNTAMHIAVANKNENIAKMLDNAGTDKTLRNKIGEFIESDGMNNKQKQKYTHEIILSDTINLSDLDSFNKNKIDSESERFIKALTLQLGKHNALSNPACFKMHVGGDYDTSTVELNFVENEIILNGGVRKRSVSPARPQTPRESSQIHDDVVKKFIDMKFSEEDAKALKSGLYSLVKEKHGELNNLNKAKKMLEYLEDKNIVNTLKSKLNELKDIIKKARELKNNQIIDAKKEPASKSTPKVKATSKAKAKAKAKTEE